MAQIATKQRRRAYPIVSPAERMPDQPEYGAQARAFEDVSGMASGLAEKFNKIDIDNQLSDYEGSVSEQYNTLLNELATDLEPSGYAKKFDAYTKGVTNQANALKHPTAKRAAQNWVTRNTGVWQRRVQYMALGRAQQNAREALSLAEIKAVEQRNLEPLRRTLTRSLNNGIVSKERVEEIITKTQAQINNGLYADEAQRISQEEGYEKAIDWVMKQKIDTDVKKGIVSDIKFEAAQQQLEYDKQIEQIEQDFLVKLRQEKLTEDEVMNAPLEVDKKQEWLRYIDAQVKERLEGEVELNWETYDRLQGLVEDYGEDKVSKDEVRQEISKAVGKDITTTVARSLRDRLATKDVPDDPMNTSAAKRGIGVLSDMESEDLRIARLDDENLAELGTRRLKWQKKKDEFESWIRKTENVTDKKIQEKISSMIQPAAEEAALTWWDKAWEWSEESPFGTAYWYRKIRPKKEGEEEKKILTPEIAGQYLNLAGGDRKRAEKLAKDAGYEW